MREIAVGDVLVTGSSGLIGSEMVRYFAPRARRVIGVDNNMRADFFGAGGDTRWNLDSLRDIKGFRHIALDIRDRGGLARLFGDDGPFDLIVHCAAQPSHDLSARRPLDDFDVNAVGTMNLLEATRQHCKEATFVYMSTSKVYGDSPNYVPLVELETRYDYEGGGPGIDESMSLDASLHSPFGASKAAADLMVQEYGQYFSMATTCLRGGCLTGEAHSAVELHGFLAYLVKCNVQERPYRVYGYKGKQVRDNIHAFDVATAVGEIHKSPPCGKVFNIGGGRGNSISILEAFQRVEELTGKSMRVEYESMARLGDHTVYISDTRRLEARFPAWKITRTLDDILKDLVRAQRER